MSARPRKDQSPRVAAYRRGLAAETLVAWCLRLKGFRILARRFKTQKGEIDIIARRGRLLLFVEVKAREETAAGWEAVTSRSRRRIVAAADSFLARHGRLADLDRRFDIAVVSPWRWPRFMVNAFAADE